MNDNLKTLIFVLVLVGIGYLLLPYLKFNSNTDDNQNAQQTQNESRIQTFNSDSQSIKFEYNTDQNNDGSADTTAAESGDKVYVYYTAAPMEQGQWVQKFDKDRIDSLATSVQKQFLKNYAAANCYPLGLADYYRSYEVEPPPIAENIEMVVIAYPKTTDPNAPYWQNANKCPPTYTAANGVSYFWMDKNYPDKYYFFSIGQYAILADTEGKKMWQDTVVVTR